MAILQIRRPGLTNADSQSELARKIVELVDELNAVLVRLGEKDATDRTVGERLDTAESDIDTLESGRVEGRGNGAANRLATWSSANAITSDADATFDGSDLTIANRLITSDPGTTLQTGLSVRVNVGGTKTTPRIMMGPTQNVGHSLQMFTIQGRNGAGAVTMTGAAVGDVVRQLQGIQPLHFVGDGSGQFESTITVANQIQQSSASDLSGADYIVLLERRSSTGATTERPLYCVP